MAEEEKLNICVLGNPVVRAEKEPGQLRTRFFPSLPFLVLKVPCVKLAAEPHADAYPRRAGVHDGSDVLLGWQVPGHITHVDLCGLYGAASGFGCAVHAPVQDCTRGHTLFPLLPGLCGASVLSCNGKQQTPDSGQNCKMSRLQRRKAGAARGTSLPVSVGPPSTLLAKLKWWQLSSGSDLNPRGTESALSDQDQAVLDRGLRVAFSSWLLEAAKDQWAVVSGAQMCARYSCQPFTHVGRNSSTLQLGKPRSRKG